MAFLIHLKAQPLPANTAWEGKLGGIRLVLKVTEDSLTHRPKAVFDSPDQGAFGLPASVRITTDSLNAYSLPIGGGFYGRFNEQHMVIAGVWKQGGKEIPLTLIRVAKVKEFVRPQTPKAPFPYIEDQVLYTNADKTITFGATLTLPRNAKPVQAVVMITGSGPEDRDETIFGHKPFWIIADYLSRRGIAVLRVDDRGMGQTTGSAASATSADYAQDVQAAISYLKTRNEIDPKRIGLIGHSEGGIIASLVANQSNDVAFIVSLAGVGVTGLELMNRQMHDAYVKAGFKPDELERIKSLTALMTRLSNEYPDNEKLKPVFKEEFEAWLAKQPAAFLKKAKLSGAEANRTISTMANQWFSPWMRYFLHYSPSQTLVQVKIPVLAMNGSKDVQVAAQENLDGFKKYLTLAGNKDFEIVLWPGLNHLFQHARTGDVTEYAQIEETIAPEVLEKMAIWIAQH